MKKNVYEILEEFKNAKTENDKKKVLVDNATPDFIAFMQCAFDPRVKFVKLGTLPPKGYKPQNVPAGLGYSNMANAIKKTYLFIENHPRRSPNLTQEKTEQLLVQILESLEAREAEMYIQMVQKNVKVPRLTLKLLEETYKGFGKVDVRV